MLLEEDSVDEKKRVVQLLSLPKQLVNHQRDKDKGGQNADRRWYVEVQQAIDQVGLFLFGDSGQREYLCAILEQRVAEGARRRRNVQRYRIERNVGFLSLNEPLNQAKKRDQKSFNLLLSRKLFKCEWSTCD